MPSVTNRLGPPMFSPYSRNAQGPELFGVASLDRGYFMDRNLGTITEQIIGYLRAAGILSSLLSAVSLVLLPYAFRYFVVLVYATIAIWVADAFFELHDYGLVYRLIPIVVGLQIVLIFSLQFAFATLSLGQNAWSTDGVYRVGAVVNGIRWSSKFNDIHLTLINSSDYDYTDLDLLVTPAQPVVAGVMVTSEPTCSIVRELFPVTSFTLQLWRQQTQTREDIPIDWFLSTGGFRVRCPFLPAHSSIEMLLALANANQQTLNAYPNQLAGPWGVGKANYWYRWQTFPMTDNLFDARPTVSTVTMVGKYIGFFRRKTIDMTIPVATPMASALDKMGKTPVK